MGSRRQGPEVWGPSPLRAAWPRYFSGRVSNEEFRGGPFTDILALCRRAGIEPAEQWKRYAAEESKAPA